MDEKSVKVNCSFCGDEMECPKEMLEDSKKHMCFECFQDERYKELNGDLSKVHIDIPRGESDDNIAHSLVNSLIEDVFPATWHDMKEDAKEMSKKEIAEQIFGEGAYVAIMAMMSAQKKMNEKEEKDEDNKD